MESSTHIVLSAKANWSHLRPLCILACRIKSTRPNIIITIIVANVEGIVDRVTREVARGLIEEAPEADASDCRVIGIRSDPTDVNILDNSFRQTWIALVSERPVQCALSCTDVVAAKSPTLAILDGFQLSWLEIIRSETSPPPIFQWTSAFSGGLMYLCGPPDLYKTSGEPIQMCGSANQKIQIPGLPAMSIEDLHPQNVGGKDSRIQRSISMMSEFMEKADGVLSAGAVEYDGNECLSAFSDWIGRQGSRKAFHLGPMLPLIPGTHQFSAQALKAEVEATSNDYGQIALDFLDKAAQSYGERSLFFISFGTEHWPSSTACIQVLLEALRQRSAPFIFAYAYHAAKIPGHFKDQYQASGQGLFLPFAPQQTILSHEACGWFITHGGFNGTIEAICQGIPMIAWPFAVDQPLNVSNLTINLDVAFELVNTRTNPTFTDNADVQPGPETLRSFEIEIANVLDAAQGEKGRIKRENAQRIGAQLGLPWSKSGGRARKELSQFLRYYDC